MHHVEISHDLNRDYYSPRPIISIANRRLEASDHKSILRLDPFVNPTSASCILVYPLGYVSGQSFVNQFYSLRLLLKGGRETLSVFSHRFFLCFSLKGNPLAPLCLTHAHRDHTPRAARRLLGRCCWAERSAGSTLKQGGRS